MAIGVAENFRDIFKLKVKIEASWDFLRLLETKFPGRWRVWKREDRVVKIFPQVISMEVRQLICFTDWIQLWSFLISVDIYFYTLKFSPCLLPESKVNLPILY